MKRFLTTGFLGAILGIVIGGAPADASLISRSFLDQALTDYATNTALDLKADQSDLTALSNKIGTLPEGITVQGMYEGWTDYNEFTCSGLNTISRDYTNLLNDFNTSGLYGLFVKGGTMTIPGFPPNSKILSLYELSNGVSKIGTLPSGNLPGFPEYEEFFSSLEQPLTYPTSLAELINAIYGNLETGAPGLLQNIILGFPRDTNGDGQFDSHAGLIPNFRLAKEANDLATTAKTAADANTAKIGTLPDGLTVANLYNGWKDPSGEYINGLSRIAQVVFTTYDPLSDTLNTGPKPETGGSLDVLASLLFEDGYYRGDSNILAPFWYLTKQAMRVGEIPRDKTAAGMIDEINTKIGTLPSGNFPSFPGSDLLFPWLNQPLTYPTSLAELITAIYGNSETGGPGLLAGIIAGFEMDTDGDGIDDSYVGTLPNFWLARDANNLATSAKTIATAAKTAADANTAKIGTLPSGNFPIFPGYELLFPVFAQSFRYPTSLAELIDAIYGNAESGRHGLLAGIIEGYGVDTNGDGINDSVAGTTPNFRLARHAIDLANANAAKIGTVPDGKNLAGMIGTLPTGYDSVGAALTAMKSDIDAKNLPSTSDDGQYVLSAKKVGDTITYTWVKMDLTNEEQAQ